MVEKVQNLQIDRKIGKGGSAANVLNSWQLSSIFKWQLEFQFFVVQKLFLPE